MKNRTPLTLLLLLLSLSAASCGGPKPRDTLQSLAKSAHSNDWNNVWNLLSSKSHKDFEQKIFMPLKEKLHNLPEPARKSVNPRFGISADEVLRMTARDYFVMVMEKTDASERVRQRFNPGALTIEQETIEKGRARVKLKSEPRPLFFVREFGAWKMEWEL